MNLHRQAAAIAAPSRKLAVAAGVLFLMIPIFAWEVTLALWLIVKGFNPSAIAAGSTQTAAKQVLITPSSAA